MTLKGKNKFLRNIIVCLVAVVFVAGIAGIVYSQNNASIKISFKDNTWDTGKEQVPSKEWFMNANENEVKFIVDLSDYKIESTNSGENGGENTKPPVEPEEPVEPEQPENPDTGETENPPVDGSEEGNETPDNAEVISEGENTQPDENNGDGNTPENNETTDKGKFTYPELTEVMDIIISENPTVEFGNTEVTKYLEEGIFKGKYEVTIPLNKEADIDYNINIQLVVKENNFEIPVTNEDNNPAKSFTIVKDNTIPTITITGVSEDYSGRVENINISLNEDSDMRITLERIKGDAAISVITEDVKNTKKFNIDSKDYEDGKYKLSVVAIDKAGNEVIEEVTFNVNKHAPIVKFNGESLKDFYNSKEAKITIDISDGNKIDYENSTVEIEGPEGFKYEGNFDGDNSEVWSDIVTLGKDGNYTVFVKTKDELSEGDVNNKEDVENFTQINGTFTLDTEKPEINVLAGDKNIQEYHKLDGYTYLNNGNIKFELNNDENLSEFKAKFTGDLDKEITNIGQDENLKDGTYELTITAKDEAGNEADVQVLKLIVDTDPVGVEFNGDIKNREHYNTDKTLEVTIDDPNLKEGSYITIKKDIKKDTEDSEQIVYFDNGQNTISKEFTEDGTYTVTVNATDKAGNGTIEENTIEFTIDKTKPVITMDDYTTLQNSFNKEDKTLNITVNEKNLTNDSEIKLTYTIPAYEDEAAVNKEINLLEGVTSSDGVYKIGYTVGTDIEWEFIESIDYKIEFDVRDEAGNEAELNKTGNKPDTLSFTIDKKAPRVSFEGVEEGKYFGIIEDNEDLQKKNNIKVVVEDANISEVNSIEIKNGTEDYIIEKLNWTIDPKNGKAELPIALIDDGHYKIKVNSTDKAGNEVIENNTIEFTIDNKKPEIGISANILNSDNNLGDAINNEQYLNTEKVQINATISDINLYQDLSLSDENANNFISITRTLGTEIKDVKEDDGVKVRTYMDKATGAINVSADVELEGTYSITVNSNDKANNGNSASFEFTIDRTNPVVEIANYNDINGEFLGDDKEVIINVTEINPRFDGEEDVIKITREKFKAEGGTEGEPITELAKVNNPDGNKYKTNGSGKYTYKVTGTDKAGNPVILKDGEKVIAISDINLVFVVDKDAPKVNLEVGNKVDNGHYKSSMSINIEVKDDTLKKNTITIIRPNGSEDIVEEFEPKLENYKQATTPYNYDFIPDGNNDGNYSVKIVSTDITGKKSTEEYSFTLDKTAPVISFTNSDDLKGCKQSFDKVIVNIDETNIAHDDTNMIVSYTKTTPDGVPSDPVVFRQRTNTATYEKDHNGNSLFADADAIYTFTVSGNDAAYNEAILQTISFTKDETKPEVSIKGVEDKKHYNEDKKVEILSHDVNHNINTVTVTKDGQNYSVGEFTVNGRDAVISHTFSQEGEYVITLYSKDEAGNENSTFVTFTIDKTKPVITPVFKGEGRDIKDGEYINKIFTPEFKLDEAEDKFDYIKLNDVEISSVPMSSTEMVYNYSIQASDDAGNVTTRNITFTVDVTNPEVKVTGIIDGYFSKDMKPEYEITDTNLDNENTIVTLNDKVFESGTKIKDQDYYNLKLLGADLASNTTARNIVFAIDKDKPVIKFLEQMSGKYFTEDFIPNFIIEDLTDYTIIAMTLDGVDYEIGDPITEEGKHVLYIEVKDKAENVESISVEFILDKTPPKFIVNGIKDKGIYVEPVTAEITLENPLDKIIGITVNGELAQGDVKEENGQQVVKLNFTDINDYEVVLKAVDEAGNETEEVINFKIAKKNIFTTIYANKTIFYPLMIALGIIAAVVVITVVKKNKKEETQEEGSEE